MSRRDDPPGTRVSVTVLSDPPEVQLTYGTTQVIWRSWRDAHTIGAALLVGSLLMAQIEGASPVEVEAFAAHVSDQVGAALRRTGEGTR